MKRPMPGAGCATTAGSLLPVRHTMLSIYHLGPSPSDSELAAVRNFGARRFHRSILLLGDLTAPLTGHTSIWVARQAGLTGVAVTFRGFPTPVVSIVADDLESGNTLLEAVRPVLRRPSLLVLNAEESLAAQFRREVVDKDLWLLRDTTAQEVEHPTSLALSPSEVAAFYTRCGMHFWTPAMLDFGHYYGIRSTDSRLVSLAGVNFVLSEFGYAQIGNVVTDRESRNKGFATSCVKAVIDSLHRSGIGRCGLFVDSQRPDLIRLYGNIGFSEEGQFCFVPLKEHL